MDVRILAFYSYDHLDYWYREIMVYLRPFIDNKKITKLICRTTPAGSFIDFGAQQWIFLVPYCNNLVGRRGPIYHGTEYLLEKDFEGTLSKIWKGE